MAGPPDLPNILMIVMDTTRRDAWEPYETDASTPTVRQLAGSGGWHDRVYAPSCWTLPSHGSLFAGGLPRSIGLDHRGGQSREGFRAALSLRFDSLLPEVLRRAGYQTRASSTNPWIMESTGFDLGFDSFVFHRSPRWLHRGEGSLRNKAHWYAQAARGSLDDGASQVLTDVEGWISEPTHGPQFWFVNLVEAHSPYLPPKSHNPYGPLRRMRSAGEATRYLGQAEIAGQNLLGNVVPPSAMARMRTLYEASVRYMDAWLARIFSLLDSRGVLSNTLVIVTSDHGENLGEAGRLGHAFSLDDRLLRVPFVWGGPLDLNLPAVAGLQDVPRAITHALGIDAGWPDSIGDGDIAVAEFDAPFSAQDPDLEHVVAAALNKSTLAPTVVERATRSFVAATDGRLKLLRSREGRPITTSRRTPSRRGNLQLVSRSPMA